MNIERLVEEITEALHTMYSGGLVRINNAHAEIYGGRKIFKNDEYFLTDHYSNNAPELARAICFGQYKTTDNWVIIDNSGNLQSWNDVYPENLDAPLFAISSFVALNFSEFYDLFDFDENSFDEE